ncbi:MAG TPA: tRNA (adenosine(37)-N6)-threonylcarbamoyltransferase complex transferase subunit TsaD [Puia sp.]|nr:tRNA (adenosine(37)-N6)-threonylcarbamoyltransferase complex transferase subunit TsaD [Puia sp.]
MSVKILAIESSCDETSAAVCCDGLILSNTVASQAIHQRYGGVVPELASRAHVQNIIPVVTAALSEAGCRLSNMSAIAFTHSPGLIGALLVGAQFAKSLSMTNGIPLIAVDHMRAHIIANLIDEPKPAFPFLCLTVSGGHTQIVICRDPWEFEIIGETLDDAAGEAFDKTAKLLGLPYPGGPLIDRYAKLGDPNRFSFPEPRLPGLDFSFSGLKTAIMYFLQKRGNREDFIETYLYDICASVQSRIVTILMHKLEKAAKETGIKDICLGGGVSANSGLRRAFNLLGEKNNWNTFIPSFQYCTDNAGMIAKSAYYKFLRHDFSPINVVPSARVNLQLNKV